jgi:hypothetical protein
MEMCWLIVASSKRVQRNLGALTPMEYHEMKMLETA